MNKIERMQVVKNEEIKNKMVSFFHFQMQVEIHVEFASLTEYFNERWRSTNILHFLRAF